MYVDIVISNVFNLSLKIYIYIYIFFYHYCACNRTVRINQINIDRFATYDVMM